MPTEKTICPACSKSTALTNDGKLRKHGYEAFSSLRSVKRTGCCYMSYELPADFASVRLAHAEKGLAQAQADLAALMAQNGAAMYDVRRARDAVDAWTRELAKARG